jgi:hypothetical protein
MLAHWLDRARRGPWLQYVGSLLYLGVATGALYLLYADWAYDDPFIVYRYARNLVSGVGFVYNPGERMLSTTTPLYVLVLAALSPFSKDLPHVSNLVGAFCLGLGGLLLWDLAHSWKTPLAGWAALALYPSFPLLGVTLGSEMPLYLALCLAALVGYARRRYSLAAVFAALATLTRPDGVLLALILAAHYWLFVRKPFPWQAVVWYAVLVLPWVIFASVYFGSPVPVTLAAKQYQGSMAISQRFAAGFLTTITPFMRWPIFWLEMILAGAGFLLSFWLWKRWMMLWAWMALYFAGYSLLGVSRYFWYYAPLVPGFVAAIGLGVAAIGHSVGSLRRSSPALSVVGNLLAGLVIFLLFWGQAQRLWRQSRSIDLRYSAFRSVGEWLAENTPLDSSVGILEIGVIGYYAGRPVVDFAGLIQPDVAPQLLGASSYEGAAQWAMQRYRPDFLVLREKLFPNLEASYVARYCREVQNFPAGATAYPWSISIYACGSGN